jgi:uncharacterized protein
MSNRDHNVVIPGAPVDQTFEVDTGLRGHMLRVYNYMATGVGLTGLIAMLTYQFTGPELLPRIFALRSPQGAANRTLWD